MATTSPLCRIETDLAEAFVFLQSTQYPAFWSLSELADAIVVRIMDTEGVTKGYAWGVWLDDGALEFHACSSTGAVLPLFSSDLLAQLIRIAFLVGADEISTSVDGHPKAATIRRLFSRLGFTETHGDVEGAARFTLNTWRYHGSQDRQRLGQEHQEEV